MTGHYVIVLNADIFAWYEPGVNINFVSAADFHAVDLSVI